MKVTKEEAATRQVVLNIQLDPPDLEPHLHQVYRRLVNRVQIPGFRKGKAPRSILENYMGREAMLREGLDSILIQSLNQALEEEHLESFGQPDMEIQGIEPLSFKAVVPLEPEVELGSYRDIHMDPEPVQVTEERVGEVLEQFRRSSGVWEPKESPLQYEDMATLNVEGSVDGRSIIDEQGVDVVLRQDSNRPFPGFHQQLEGIVKGEAREFTLTISEDYPSDELAGKECSFQVKALELKTLSCPDLDDEFAKGVGSGYESLEALRSDVRQRLEEEAQRETHHTLQEQVLEEVIKGASVVFSPLTEERELDHMLEERTRALREHKVSTEEYLRSVNKTEEEAREELRPEAVRRLTRFLVLRKVAQEEGIEVSDEEVEEEVSRMAEGSGQAADSVRQAFSTPDARAAIHNATLTRKVMDRLAEIAQGSSEKVQEEEPAESPSPEEPPTGGSTSGQ